MSISRTCSVRSLAGDVVRNYFQPQLRKRFGHGDGYHVDQEAGAVSKGMYIATFDYLKRVFGRVKDLSTIQDCQLCRPGGDQKTMFEGAIVLATIAIGHMLSNMMDDDDDSYAVEIHGVPDTQTADKLLQFLTPGEFPEYLTPLQLQPTLLVSG